MKVDKRFIEDDQIVDLIAKALTNCAPNWLDGLKSHYHLTVEQIWSIENASRIMELLCM